MTAAELRELAQECADELSDWRIPNEEWEDLADACRRLENAAAILDGAHE